LHNLVVKKPCQRILPEVACIENEA